MLSQTAEHALRAMLFLSRDGGGEYRPSNTIAEALKAPPRYLARTLSDLVAAGLLESTRGPGGGVRLARSPSAITVAEVVGMFEEPAKVPPCLSRGGRCGDDPCASHVLWCRLKEQALVPFRQTTLDELARGVIHNGDS